MTDKEKELENKRFILSNAIKLANSSPVLNKEEMAVIFREAMHPDEIKKLVEQLNN